MPHFFMNSSRFAVLGLSLLIVACTTQPVEQARDIQLVASSSSESSESSVPSIQFSILRDGVVTPFASTQKDLGSYVRWNSVWGADGKVYVNADGARTVTAIDASGIEKNVFFVTDDIAHVTMWPSNKPGVLYVRTIKSVAQGPDDLPPQPFDLFALNAETLVVTPIVAKDIQAFSEISFVGEMTNGDVVYCECSQEGGESITGTLFIWRSATGKTERLRDFSVGSLWMLDGTDTLILAGMNDVVPNPLVSYDLKTKKEKTVWRFPGKNEWGFISVNTYSKEAIAISLSGTYVISLTDGKMTFEKRWSQSEPQNVYGVWYPLATRKGEYYKGMGQMGREAGLLTLKEDGFHLQKLPSYEVVGYVDSGALLLGGR